MVRKRCGKCGQVGHNRRTCGKNVAVPESPVLAAARKQTAPSVPAASNIGETFTAYRNTSRQKNVAGERKEPEKETLTAQEVETLWFLTSGRTGKLVKGQTYTYKERENLWTKDDNAALSTMLETVMRQGTAEKELHKFLRTFSAKALDRLAYTATTPPQILGLLVRGNLLGNAATIVMARKDAETLPDDVLKSLRLHRDAEIRRQCLMKYRRRGLSAEEIRQMWDNPPRQRKDSDDKQCVMTAYAAELARQENCPADVLEHMLQRELYTSPRMLHTLYAALGNRNMRPETLAAEYRFMRGKKDLEVAVDVILSNPRTPRNIVDKVFDAEPYREEKPETEQRRTARMLHDNELVAALANPATSSHLIEQEYFHPTGTPTGTYRRYMNIARNPNTPLHIVEDIARKSRIYLSNGKLMSKREATFLLEQAEWAIKDRGRS